MLNLISLNDFLKKMLHSDEKRSSYSVCKGLFEEILRTSICEIINAIQEFLYHFQISSIRKREEIYISPRFHKSYCTFRRFAYHQMPLSNLLHDVRKNLLTHHLQLCGHKIMIGTSFDEQQ